MKQLGPAAALQLQAKGQSVEKQAEDAVAVAVFRAAIGDQSGDGVGGTGEQGEHAQMDGEQSALERDAGLLGDLLDGESDGRLEGDFEKGFAGFASSFVLGQQCDGVMAEAIAPVACAFGRIEGLLFANDVIGVTSLGGRGSGASEVK